MTLVPGMGVVEEGTVRQSWGLPQQAQSSAEGLRVNMTPTQKGRSDILNEHLSCDFPREVLLGFNEPRQGRIFAHSECSRKGILRILEAQEWIREVPQELKKSAVSLWRVLPSLDSPGKPH